MTSNHIALAFLAAMFALVAFTWLAFGCTHRVVVDYPCEYHRTHPPRTTAGLLMQWCEGGEEWACEALREGRE